MSEHRAHEFREVRTLSRRLLALLLLSILLFGPHATRSTMASIGVVSSVPAAQAPPAESGTSQAGRWTMASLGEPHTGGTAVTVGNTVLFAGGATSGTPSDVVEIYDRSSGQWTRAALARGRVGPSTARVGTGRVVAGGRESSGEAPRLVDLYDLASGEWSVATLHSPW